MLEVGKSCMMFLIRLEWKYIPYHDIHNFTCQGTGVGNQSCEITELPFSVSRLYDIWYFIYRFGLFPVVVVVVVVLCL